MKKEGKQKGKKENRLWNEERTKEKLIEWKTKEPQRWKKGKK